MLMITADKIPKEVPKSLKLKHLSTEYLDFYRECSLIANDEMLMAMLKAIVMITQMVILMKMLTGT